MSGISSALIKTLREKTGAGMSDCKTALVETHSDIEAAVDWLRKKGMAAAAKKSFRITADGLVSAYQDGNRAGPAGLFRDPERLVIRFHLFDKPGLDC